MIDKNYINSIIDSEITDIEKINKIKKHLYENSPEKCNPVDCVIWVSKDKVEANDYNPNSVARTEMQLLHTSIDHDGYTQPIVTIYDKKRDKYIIIDGYHRYFVGKTCKDIIERNNGLLPIVVLDKPINDRMASTIRHNRARGKHSINGMSNIVFSMLHNGWTDEAICNELGMEAEELVRLKYITGFAKLFDNVDYKKSWATRNQLFLKKKYNENPNLTAKELNEIKKEEFEKDYKL